MLMQLLKTDPARGAVVAATLTVLITLTTALMSTGMFLVVDNLSAMHRLSQRVKPPGLVQVHSGRTDDRDQQTIEARVQAHDDVIDHEIIKTLSVARQELSVNDAGQSESYNESAFVTSPRHPNLLFNDGSESVSPESGEAMLSVHYQAISSTGIGDTITVSSADRTTALTIAEFARDAQMNATMIPSRRLVVSPKDFSALEQQIIGPEYLIKMSLIDSARPGGVIDAYKEAGLPSNDTNVSAPMIQLMNSLDVMFIMAVTPMVAVVLAVVAALALHYTMLAVVKMGLAQVTVLRAIEAPLGRIHRLCIAKYLALSVLGIALGYMASQPLATVLEVSTTLYLDRPATILQSVKLSILVALVLALGIIGFTQLTLRRIDRISTIEALHNGTSASLHPCRQHWKLMDLHRLPVQMWLGARETLHPSSALMLGVLALCTFTVVLPTNVSSTPGNPYVVAYLGTGRVDLRIGVHTRVQNLTIMEKTADSDPHVTQRITILCRNYKMSAAGDGSETTLIDIGDHETFPMEYLPGHTPTTDDEVVLSYNQAQDTGAKEGATVTIRTADSDENPMVMDAYQDIINSGHVAKTTFSDGTPALWQIVCTGVGSTQQASTPTKQLSGEYPGTQAVNMNQYAAQFLGATNSQAHVVTTLACVIALRLSFLIMVLFIVLIVSQGRPQIGILIALGCTGRTVAGQHLIYFGLLALARTALGLLGASVLGNPTIRAAMASHGAPNLQLPPNRQLTGLALPGMLLATVIGATALTLRHLRTMSLTMTLTIGE